MLNWFPGHMSKTLREMSEKAKLCDCFIYVLDARCPMACLNPEFIKIIKTKPIVYVLNKSDLANSAKNQEWKNYFNSLENSKCVLTNATASKSCSSIVSAINQLLQEKIQMNKERNVNFVFRAMVLGVPNSGKSTIVNNLCGKTRAVTGDKPGVTRNTQWANVSSSLQIMDTPGTLWPALTDEKLAYELAFVGSIKDDVLDLFEISSKLLRRLLEISPTTLNQKYKTNMNLDMEDYELVETIAKKRGCIVRGGEIDEERVSKLIIGDFRKGELGHITFD
ncbi:MAG: ribosome biogenesis GTPase YlqF [Clostridia bacterium]|nr:ribosome biogenesis GTPase YlqF [Clostridia bacterium]